MSSNESSSAEVKRARRGLFVYLGVVVVCTAAIQAHMIHDGRLIEEQFAATLLLMWLPCIASVVARLVLREGLADVSLRWGGLRGTKTCAVVWVYPMLVGAVGYGLAWATGLATFRAPRGPWLGLAHDSSVLAFFMNLGVLATLGTVLSAISAAGEELGWRGYMLTRLVEARIPRPALVSGVVWGVWHTPLIFSGLYAAGPNPVLSVPLFLISIVFGGYVAAWARLRSGSVWPAILFHSAWNAIIQGVFDAATAGGSASHTTNIWIGESGVLVAVASALVATPLLLERFVPLRTPREPIRNAAARALYEL